MNPAQSRDCLTMAGLCVLTLIVGMAPHDLTGPTRPTRPTLPNGPPVINASFASVFGSPVPAGIPQGVVMDLPLALRQANWGGGSCVHASTVSLLRWQGQHQMADWWRRNYSGGEYSYRLVQRMEAAGLRYAYTDQGDLRFLEWAVRTGRGAGILYKPRHAINLVGLDQTYAYLLDNNSVDYDVRRGHWERVPRAEFERHWRSRGGFGWTLVYDPPPPLPRL